MVAKTEKETAKKQETSNSEADVSEFDALFEKIGNMSTILAPSNIEDNDYKIVGRGVAQVDYKDGNGAVGVPYFEFQTSEGEIVKAKVTARLKEALTTSGIDYEHEAFHFKSAGKAFNMHVTITPSETM